MEKDLLFLELSLKKILSEDVMISSNTSEKTSSSRIPINRGVNLILNGVDKPKKLVDFSVHCRLFKRDIKLSFSFDVKK